VTVPTPDEASGLSPAALALLASRAPATRGAARPARDSGPLAYPQLTQWFFAHLYPRSSVFNLPKILSLRGQADVEALRTALQSIVEHQPALRTRFTLEDGDPVQRIAPPLPIELICHDLTSASPAERNALGAALLEQHAARPFDLATDQLVRAMLIRVGDDDWQLQLTLHHVVFDGWSTGVLLADFEQAYRAAIAGTSAGLAGHAASLIDAAASQRALEGSAQFTRDRQYWKELLRGVAPLDVPLDDPGPAQPVHRGEQRSRMLGLDAWNGVQACARAHACTPFAILFAAWAALAARRCSQPRAMVGVTVAGRTDAAWEALIGNFVNVLPVVADVDDSITFSELVAQVRQRSAEALAHQQFPFQQLAQDIAPARRSACDTLFPVLFNYRNVPLRVPENLPGLRVTGLRMPARGSVGPLALNVTPQDGSLLLELDFDPDALAGVTADRWLDAYDTILRAAVERPTTPVCRLPVAGPTECAMFAAWNDTDTSRDRTLTVDAMLSLQAAATPERVALSSPDGDWTYRQLEEHATRLAVVLRNRGAGPGVIVGVCMERCAGLLAAMRGVLVAGAAYLPIDHRYPAERIDQMLDDAGATIVLVGPGTPDALDSERRQLLSWDLPDELPAAHGNHATASPQDPAYVIFTSGSTGRAKGVVVSHASLANFLQWATGAYRLGPDDVLVLMSSISVDRAVWECWLALVSGGRLVVPAPDTHFDPVRLIDVIVQQRVSVIGLVSGVLRALLDTGRLAEAAALRIVSCGGDALTWDLIAAFKAAHPATLLNEYGPTETCIISTSWRCDIAAGSGAVPIGVPIANTCAHVVDARGEPAAIGTPGELCIGGAGVALGYAGLPELTAERFVSDRVQMGLRRTIYRTGDLARWRHDGLLEFLGRVDGQVKIRGFRVEPGEIEAVLGAIAGISSAAVVVPASVAGDNRLVAFVTPSGPAPPDEEEIRATLRRQLPPHMIPSRVHFVPAMPMLPSGKIDRGALRQLCAESSPALPTEDARELTPLERSLREAWIGVLGSSHVGLDDDFFDLGGHSLLAARMVSEFERSTGVRIAIATLFAASTIRQLARAIVATPADADEPAIHEVQRGTADRPAFFMLTGDLIGGGFYCRGLAQAAGPEQPFYAMHPLPVASNFRDATIERMAARHLTDLRRVRPTGPYRLGGFCIGGLVAYEMARTLRAQGETVELLLLVDPVPPVRYGALIRLALHAASLAGGRGGAARRDRYGYLNDRIHPFLAQKLPDRLAATARYVGRLARRIARRARLADATNVVPEPDAPTRLRMMFRQHSHAEWAYRRAAYSGRVDIIVTAAAESRWGRPATDWERVAPHLQIHRTPAAHADVIFTAMPAILRDQLDRVNAERLP